MLSNKINVEKQNCFKTLHTLNINYRYTSRCTLIQFASPCLDPNIVEFTKLNSLFPDVSKAIGFCIGLGEKFVKVGIEEMSQEIIPFVKECLKGVAFPRVLTSYSILLWFTEKVCFCNVDPIDKCIHGGIGYHAYA